nr:hypothetical protein [Tanacetum cinerariifolium]
MCHPPICLAATCIVPRIQLLAASRRHVAASYWTAVSDVAPTSAPVSARQRCQTTGQRRWTTVVIGGQWWQSTIIAGGGPPLIAAGPPVNGESDSSSLEVKSSLSSKIGFEKVVKTGEDSSLMGTSHLLSSSKVTSYSLQIGTRFLTLDFITSSDSVSGIVLRCSSSILREYS